ncbi:MAG TPA: GGDEF domain-containing protein [Terriglobales bacterium]|nr:GGDEF domain-containing protein [Terriglobales bacterium]
MRTLKSLFVPGGALLLCEVIIVATGVLRISVGALQFYFYALIFAGALLAWRFHSSRILFALITLLLAYRAIDFFSPGRPAFSGPGRIAFEAVAFLIPLNFIFVSFVRERGFAIPAIASRIALLFFESVFVAVISRPGERTGPALIHNPIVGLSRTPWTPLPELGLLTFVIAFGVLLLKFFLHRKPLESGLLWSTVAAFVGLQNGGISKDGTAYFAAAALILLSSIVENTYALAYQDELTSLPSRRAFNEALPALTAPYSIAVVDIDHFKNFNDTYGHETGDQVLRLVAGRLASVGGGGKAFRIGGEEFSILFSGKSMKEVLEHLEMLRATIEVSSFRLREAPERRAEARGPDRRNDTRKKSPNRKPAAGKSGGPAERSELSVTVSIGVAEPTAKTRDVEQVIHLADKALYRAKHAGRNRVEAFRATRSRSPRGAGRSIA